MRCSCIDFRSGFYNVFTFTQSQPDVTVKGVKRGQMPSSENLECVLHPTVPVSLTLRQQDLMTNVITDVLRSTHRNSFIVCSIQEVLDRQDERVSDMVRKALQLVWYAQHSTEGFGVSIVKEIMTSVIRNEIPFRQIDGVIILGINDMLPSGQLNNFIMDTIQDLLASGDLDNTIHDGVQNLLFSQHEDPTAIAALAMLVSSRQLDDILLDIFAEFMSAGKLDDIFVSAISHMLQSEKMDRIIRISITLLENEVRLIHGIATVHSIYTFHCSS